MAKAEEVQTYTNEVKATESDSGSSTGLSVQKKPQGGHARRYQKLWNGYLGFTKQYNFPLWVIFAGGMFGFCIRSCTDFDYLTLMENLGPGLWEVYGSGKNMIALYIHLAAIIPAMFFMILQFVPRIRQTYITFHRMNGYLILFLCIVSNGATCAVLYHNQGGNRIAAQTLEAALSFACTVGCFMAWYNIRRLQIDEHRAWMLRTMFYYGSVPTNRLLCALASLVVTKIGGYYLIWSCDELTQVYQEYDLGGIPGNLYPQCYAPNATADTMVPVVGVADISMPAAFGSAYNTTFGSMAWITFMAHMVGVEIYLNLTTAESMRLRKVSYERQLKAGFKHPGDSGATALRWGDGVRFDPETHVSHV